MEKKFSGKIWKFGNDIDTDTIIPGKRGTIPDRNEMKKYAFELLKPEFGSTVQPGDILVAGTNFGCGSSRQLPFFLTMVSAASSQRALQESSSEMHLTAASFFLPVIRSRMYVKAEISLL